MENKTGLKIAARSEVPGYMGYIPGARAENMYGTTYANIVRESKQLSPSGQQLPPELQYLTINLNNSHRIRSKIDAEESDPQGKFWKDSQNLTILHLQKEQVIKEVASKLKQKGRHQPCFDMTLQQAYNGFK